MPKTPIRPNGVTAVALHDQPIVPTLDVAYPDYGHVIARGVPRLLARIVPFLGCAKHAVHALTAEVLFLAPCVPRKIAVRVNDAGQTVVLNNEALGLILTVSVLRDIGSGKQVPPEVKALVSASADKLLAYVRRQVTGAGVDAVLKAACATTSAPVLACEPVEPLAVAEPA